MKDAIDERGGSDAGFEEFNPARDHFHGRGGIKLNVLKSPMSSPTFGAVTAVLAMIFAMCSVMASAVALWLKMPPPLFAALPVISASMLPAEAPTSIAPPSNAELPVNDPPLMTKSGVVLMNSPPPVLAELLAKVFFSN